MRLLITIPDLAEDSGGPSLSAVRTAEHAAALGANVAIAYRNDARRRVPGGNDVLGFPVLARARNPLSNYLTHHDAIRAAIESFKPEVVYDFGIWLPQNIASFRAATSHGLPWVSSPRGMLEPWPLGSKAFKKILAWRLYQRRILLRARALVATSTEECSNLKALLPGSTIWLIPNGVDLPPPRQAEPVRSERQALFLSRLDPKKQPDLLIRAWAKVRPAGWRLVIAGPGSTGYRNSLLQLICDHQLQSCVELREAAYGEAKETLLCQSQLFVLPTFSENFGITVAEALAHGLPVITTTGTPWGRIEQDRCGWYISPTETSVATALREACALPREILSEMGHNGRKVALEYSWSGTARKLLDHCNTALRDTR